MILDFMKGGLGKVKKALSKTRSFLSSSLADLFSRKIDEESLDALEEIFYQMDFGVDLSTQLVDEITHIYKKNKDLKPDAVLELIKEKLRDELISKETELHPKPEDGPCVLLMVGINGSGKTTSTAKLANSLKKQGKKVLIAAADTFRAAAVDQLRLWADRIGVDLVKSQQGSDPAALVFDALQAARARGIDYVIIDTAGRQQNKVDLMQELEKIKRVCTKFSSHAPHEVLLLLDATLGQNAIEQAEVFKKYVNVSGIILSKIDGSAKGGMALAIQRKTGIPLKFLATGESIEDFEVFSANNYIRALFEESL